MTTMPQPATPRNTFAAVYDAWNRLIQLSDGGNIVAQYEYTGQNRRIIKKKYAGGVLAETRRFYYSAAWQAVEERVGTSSSANRQFVWGLRYIDDLLVRDRDATGGGTLNERFYALQDPNWNVTALADITGIVQERNAYDGYGAPTVLTPAFAVRGASLYDWETLYAGYRWDADSLLYQVRRRSYHTLLGCWLQRDPVRYQGGDYNLYGYLSRSPLTHTDPKGLTPNLSQPPGPDNPLGPGDLILESCNRAKGFGNVGNQFGGPEQKAQGYVRGTCKIASSPYNSPGVKGPYVTTYTSTCASNFRDLTQMITGAKKSHGRFNNIGLVSHCGGQVPSGPGGQLDPGGDRFDADHMPDYLVEAIQDGLGPLGIVTLCCCGYRDAGGHPTPAEWDRKLQQLADRLDRTVCACASASYSLSSSGCRCGDDKDKDDKICKHPSSQWDSDVAWA